MNPPTQTLPTMYVPGTWDFVRLNPRRTGPAVVTSTLHKHPRRVQTVKPLISFCQKLVLRHTHHCAGSSWVCLQSRTHTQSTGSSNPIWNYVHNSVPSEAPCSIRLSEASVESMSGSVGPVNEWETDTSHHATMHKKRKSFQKSIGPMVPFH
ncbi:hypothetical protein VTI74DRAFT_5720 [Chaetomium olivicolor]